MGSFLMHIGVSEIVSSSILDALTDKFQLLIEVGSIVISSSSNIFSVKISYVKK